MFLTEKKEILYGIGILCGALFLINSFFFGGLNLGFSIGICLCILCSGVYLRSRGNKLRFYPSALLVLAMVIAASFARSDDTPVKLLLLLLILVSLNLSLCLSAKKNSFDSGTAASLLDSFTTMFVTGFGFFSPTFRGMAGAFRRSGRFGKQGGALLLGLVIAIPLLIILIPLLMRSDAAFEGLIDTLPQLSLGEIFITALFGTGSAIIFYSRTVALQNIPVPQTGKRAARGLSSLTVNTVLVAVCLVYCAYLVSQLAYFSGGFSGILPQSYTLAEYARRGFFEMAWLCALNLSVIIGSLWVCAKKDRAPLLTRLLCLFVGVVTLFLVAAASAKMLLYIDSYGLTRLRVLTQAIMVFLGIVTLLVCLWLFIRKLSYMKVVMLTALAIGAVIGWTDVDTLVAQYNTNAYLSGTIASVDVSYLGSLGDGAVPYLVQLAEDAADPQIRTSAREALSSRRYQEIRDFRSWNYARYAAGNYSPDYIPKETADPSFETDDIGFSSRPAMVIDSLGPCYIREYYSSGGFQDFTNYGKYTYSTVYPEDNSSFHPMTAADIQTLQAFLDDYEQWVTLIQEDDPNQELAKGYDFNRDIIDTKDYLYLYEDPDYPKFGCYDIYFLDSQTNTLYYFHNNI